MKKARSKNLKICALTSMSIFTLFTCFSAAIAWFQAKKSLNDNVDDFKVQQVSGLLKKITIHTLDSQDDTNYVFNSTPKGTVTIGWDEPNQIELDGDTAVSLGQYNPMSISQPLLLLFELNEAVPANLVPLLATTETEGFVGRVEDADNNPLTSVIKTTSNSYLTSPISDGSTTFNITKSSMSGETHFVNISYDSTGFPIIDAEDGFSQEEYFFTTDSTDTIQYIAVIVDYYEDAMTYLFAVNLGNPLFDMDVADETKGIINFVCDWTMVI